MIEAVHADVVWIPDPMGQERVWVAQKYLAEFNFAGLQLVGQIVS